MTYTLYNVNTASTAVENNYCNPTHFSVNYTYVPDICLHVKSKIPFFNYAMMIICSLVNIITIHTQKNI